MFQLTFNFFGVLYFITTNTNEPAPCRPKRNSTSRDYETRIEQFIFESHSDFDFTDSVSDYMGETVDDSETDDEMSDTEQNINT